MKRYDTINLIKEAPQAHGVFDYPTETKYAVFCEIQSVGMNETYRMLDAHLKAEYTFILATEDEYLQCEGCKIVEYNNKRYSITRVALEKNGQIKLVCSSEIRDRGD